MDPGKLNVQLMKKLDCDEMDNPPYVGVPAPAYLEYDPWFGPAPVRSEKQLDYMQREDSNETATASRNSFWRT